MNKLGTSTKDLGARVRSQRLERGLTLRRLADQSRMSLGHLSALENGLHDTTGQVLLRFSAALCVSIDWLLTGSPASPGVRMCECEHWEGAQARREAFAECEAIAAARDKP